MSSLLSLADLPVRRIPKYWYILHHKRKKLAATPSSRHGDSPDGELWMDDVTESVDSSDSQSPVPPGVIHWEEQRRQWTKGFKERTGGEVATIVFLYYIGFY